METLIRNPFTDERLKDLIIVEVIKRDSVEVLGMRNLYDIIESLDPYANPVTKHELRAWLLDNGFEEDTPFNDTIRRFRNIEKDESFIINFDDCDDDDWYMRSQIEKRASKRNINPFILYVEIKLKYGTNNK